MTPKKLIAVTLVAASLGVVGTADAAVKKTKITISADEGTFEGSLSSSKASCESDRKVTLFRLVFKKKNVKIGSDVANDDGDWTVDSAKTGKFLASVKATSKCGAATSKVITVKSDE